MLLAPNALASLEELNALYPTDRPDQLPANIRNARIQALNHASAQIEEMCDRRFVYRAPPEIQGSANIVAEVTLLGASNLTVLGDPTAPGRTLIVTKTDADGSVTAGLLTVTGTVAGVAGVNEVFDLALGPVLHGVKFFTAISAAALSGVVGAAAADMVKIGTSLGSVEYHSPCRGSSKLLTLERPLRQVLEVNEDIDRAYGSTTVLVAGTGYQVRDSEMGHLVRLSSSFESYWAPGYRPIRLLYSAGYFTSANVPLAVKEVCLRLAAMMCREQQGKTWGLSGQSNPEGNWQRFDPVGLTEAMQQSLGPHMRARINLTGERDWDLEAA